MALSFYFLILFFFEIVLGTLVLLRNYRVRANLFFFGVAISLAMWTLSWFIFVNTKEIFWVRFTFVWGGLILSFYWLIGFYYLNKKRVSRSFAVFLCVMNAVITVFALSGNGLVERVYKITDFGYLSEPGSLQSFYRLFIAVGIVFAIVTMYRRIRRAETEEKKAKLTWLFAGTLVFSIFAAFSSALAPVLLGETNITGFGPLTSLPYTLFFAIAIIKYRISDIRASLFKGILRVATMGVLFAALAIPFTSVKMMSFIMALDRTILFFALMVIISLIYFYFSYFIPLVDRFFSKQQRMIRKEIIGFRAALGNVTGVKDLLQILEEFLSGRLDYRFVDFVSILGEEPEKEKVLKPLFPHLLQEEQVIEKTYLSSHPEIQADEQSAIDAMTGWGASLLMPFSFQGTLFGVLFLDRKDNTRLLSSFQLEILNSIRREVSNVFFRIRLLRKLADSEAREFYTRELQEKNDQLSHRNTIIERDMEMARKIQQTLIPIQIPEMDGVSVATIFIPLEKIAGDFFDFFHLRRHRIGVFIGDVSGHGVPAALIASMAKMILGDLSNDALMDPAAVLAYLNHRLIDSMDNNFVTACYGILDLTKQTFQYSNAAHPAMLLMDGLTKKLRRLEGRGKAIGVIPDPEYHNTTVRITPGSRLFLFTDGCFEVFNDSEEMFGEERLASSILKNKNSSINNIGKKLEAAVRNHSSVNELDDDFTLVMMETEGRG